MFIPGPGLCRLHEGKQGKTCNTEFNDKRLGDAFTGEFV